MHMRRILVAAAAAASTAAPSARAFAFGGTADHLGRQGNFVVSNRANLGFSQTLNAKGTSVDLAPELDYFVTAHLAVGGAALFHWDSSNTSWVGVAPQVAYDVVLSPTWSFWPRLALTLAVPAAPREPAIELSAPFLVHPAEHFFFGFGPAIGADLAGPHKVEVLFGTFLVGGYFDS